MTEKINIRELALAVLLEAGKKEQKSSQLKRSCQRKKRRIQNAEQYISDRYTEALRSVTENINAGK